MEEQKKCSSNEHLEINAKSYCQKCEIYMCNKCEKIHSGLCPRHNIYNLNENIKEIFTGYCKEEYHSIKLEYFCKDHNRLCCGFCLCKIKGVGKGQHNECNACFINEIESEKKKKLKENIKTLEDLLFSLEKSINEIKKLYEQLNQNKEEIKLKITNIFTKIRNALNEREDKLLLEVDKQYNNIFSDENIIENLPNKIQLSLEKGKKIDKEWKNNELIYNINGCIIIENNINHINNLNEIINKYNLDKNQLIKLSLDDNNEINNFMEIIRNFGQIYYYKNSPFKFKKCPNNINENRKYIISGEKGNILTKIGPTGYWMGTICENVLEKSKEYKWKIKLLKSELKYVMVGVAPIDFDINSSLHNTYGWYFYCANSTLYSGPPHNYLGKYLNLGNVKEEIIIIMNMEKRTLKFIINNEDKGDSFTNIPIDKPLVPAICLYHQNDTVEIINC